MNSLHGVLVWVTFLAREIDSLVTVMSDCLKWVESVQKNLTPQQLNALKTVRENVNQLTRLMEGLYHLTRSDRFTNTGGLEEIDIKDTLEWVLGHLKGLVEERKITVDLKGIEDISRLMVDERYLAQGLFYLLRSEVQASMPGDHIMVRLSENSEDLITITIINPTHYIPDHKLTALTGEQPEVMLNWNERGDLSLAKVLLKGIGGEIDIKSAEGEGTLYTVFVPKIWQSSLEEIKTLRSAAEISRKEAKTQIDTISHFLASSSEQMSAGTNESLEALRSKVQELSVLCNRSLFTADDLSRKFEAQQEQLLQQEVTYLATLEAFLSISKVIARSMNVNFLFDLDSAQQVAKYALAIADEFRLSKSERQALHYSALLKDIAMVSSPQILVERKIVPALEEATALKRRFNLVWKSLSRIPFLSSALVLLHMSERYDGTSGSFEGTDIPTGARILAVADAFNSMVSGLSPQGKLDPEMAMQQLIADPVRRFDPDVVNTFARIWKKNRLVGATNKLKWGDTVNE
jgi:response regulator RpfG family c-di-GMP phosphodiesterase